MKLEQLLQIYWVRGFLFGGNISDFNVFYYKFIKDSYGISFFFTKFIIKKFEYNYQIKLNSSKLVIWSKFDRQVINSILSTMIAINHSLDELVRLILIRLYLIKSFKGKAQSLGKPSRGQRTWSNAWTSYKYNKTIRQFITEMLKFDDNQVSEHSKYISNSKKISPKKKKKINLWS